MPVKDVALICTGIDCLRKKRRRRRGRGRERERERGREEEKRRLKVGKLGK